MAAKRRADVLFMNKVGEQNVANRAQPQREPPIVRRAEPPPPPPPRRGFDDGDVLERGAPQGARARAIPQPLMPQAIAKPAQRAPAPAEPFGRAPSGAARLSPNDLGVISQDQRNTNACGTTSLANVMTHFGMPRTHQQIDRAIRAFDMFTAPDRLVDYARASGMRASLKADASMNDITRMIDRGVPPIVLYDPGAGDDAGLHYATVSGYNRGGDQNVSSVILANSAGGARQTMPADEFQRRWANLQLHGVNTGMNNIMISALPNDQRRIRGGDGVVRRASSIALPQSTLGAELRSSATRAAAQMISDAAVTARRARDGAEVVGDATMRGARWARDRAADGATVLEQGARRLWRSVFD